MKKTSLVTMVVLAILVFSGCSIKPGISSAEIQRLASSIENEVVPKVNEEIARVQPQILGITKALQEQKLSGNETSDLIAMLQTANAVSIPFNPYAVPIGTALTFLSAVLGIFAGKKAKEADSYARKYKAHKQGVERAIKTFNQHDSVTPETVELNLFDSIGMARENNGV